MENDERLMAAKTLVTMFLRNCCNCTYELCDGGGALDVCDLSASERGKHWASTMADADRERERLCRTSHHGR